MVWVRSLKLGVLLSAVAGGGALTSCGDAPERARVVVLEAGFRFTIGDFLKAAGEGRGAVVAQFLTAGMNVNAVDREGCTALRMAAQGGHSHLVGQLLAAGAAVDLADGGGVTALMAAAAVGDVISVQQLRTAGADPARVDGAGRDALQAAAAAGHAGVVALLVPAEGGSTEEVLWVASGAGHTGVIDGLLQALDSGKRARLDWRRHLQAAAGGGHLPALRLLSSRMPESPESNAARWAAVAVGRAAGQAPAAAFLEEELRRTGEVDEAAPGTPEAMLAEVPEAADAATEGGGEASLTSLTAFSEATAIPAAMVPTKGPSRLAGARFVRLNCQAMKQVPEVLTMRAWERCAWPLLLKDVALEHESAEVILTDGVSRTVTLRVGDEIPGTGCVVEKLRRRRLYADAAETVLKNVSELHFRQMETGALFKAGPEVPVLSHESRAELLLAGSDGIWTVQPGDEFRLGSLLLRVTEVAADGITVENRLTRETIRVPLTLTP